MNLGLRTPFGWPVGWAEVRVTGGAAAWEACGDRRCLVVSSRRLGPATPNPFEDFLLVVIGEGAGRGSQVAQAAFVEAFLASDDVDVLWRLRDAVTAADGRLATFGEGRVISTLTALCMAGDGTAYGVSVGSSPLLVLPAGLDAARAQKLGREPGTAVGTGEATSGVGGVIEQWWPDMDGDGTRTRLEPGTVLVLAGAERPLDEQTGVAVRFDGGQVSTSQLVADSGWLVCAFGYQTAAFGFACLSDEDARSVVPAMLGAALELECSDVTGLERCFAVAGGDFQRTRLAAVVGGPNGGVFGAGGASGERNGEDAFTLRLGSDPLDRGVSIEFQEPPDLGPLRQRRDSRRRWRLRLAWVWRRLRRQRD
jgi:hypothetical protein